MAYQTRQVSLQSWRRTRCDGYSRFVFIRTKRVMWRQPQGDLRRCKRTRTEATGSVYMNAEQKQALGGHGARALMNGASDEIQEFLKEVLVLDTRQVKR